MKTKIALVILLSLFIAGCSNEGVEVRQSVEPDSEKELNVFQSIQYEEGSPERDMSIESIVLLTDAPKQSDGTIGRDDGDNFALKAVLADGEIEIIPLQYFQLTSFDIASFFKLNEDEFCVLVNIKAQAGYEIREYTFEPDKKRFAEEIIYEASNINYLREDTGEPVSNK